MIGAAIAIAALAALFLLVRLIEPALAFFPTAGEDVTPAAHGVPFRAATIVTSDSEQLQLWHLERDSPLARVLYFHGNGGNLSMWSPILAGLWQRGYDVIAIDYRGYGLSTGRPSEAGLYRDVDAALAYVHERAPKTDAPLVYWGRSLGTPMAAYAASRRPPAGVVLEAGFPAMRSVLETNPVLWTLSWLSGYRFPTAAWMSSVTQPTLVLHGDRDSVIPYRLGQRLFASIAGPKTFVTIAGGDHNDAEPSAPEAYWTAVGTFAGRLRAPAR